MNKYLFIFIVLFFTLSCNTRSNNTTSNLNCLECIDKIIQSSDAYLLDYKNYKTRIERISGDSVIIQAYTINDIGDTGSEHAYVTSTLGWFLLLADKLELYNTSADPENLVAVNFDKTILENNPNLLKECRNLFEKRDTIDKKESVDNLPRKQLTNLPFIFQDYFEWQLEVDMSEIEDDGRYPRNYIEDNKFFKEEFNRYFGKDTIPSSYYIFNDKRTFNTILMVCTVKNRTALFYKIITLKNNHIIDQFTIYIHDIGKLSNNFKITKDLHITKYSSENIEDEYQIEDDGKIVKIE